jgi:hypothetical protein
MENKRVFQSRVSLLLLACVFLAGAAQAEIHETTPHRQADSPAAHKAIIQRNQLTLNEPTARWAIEEVDGLDWSKPGNRNLALDAAGNPYIAFGGNHLYYAWKEGSSWQVEIADDIPEVASHSSMVLDGAGLPHISYTDKALDTLKYAHFDGVDWQIQTLDDTGNLGRTSSLALDAAGNPHIAYDVDLGLGLGEAIRYIHYDGTDWQIQTIEGGPHLELDYPSLALDHADRPHISYWNSESNILQYAYYDGADWQTETVDSSSYVPQCNSSLAVDDAGQPHIAYCGEFDYSTHVKYAYYDGTTWHSEILSSADGELGYSLSLVLGAAGRPHISYEGFFGELMYAHHDGAAWQFEMVDSDTQVAYGPSLVLDSAGYPHIAYFESLYASKYAYYNGASWQFEIVDVEEGTAFRSLSLVLDAADWPHIAYYEKSPYDYSPSDSLRYAYYDGTGWQIEIVESVIGDKSQHAASLVLDAAGHPHISYIDPINGDLKYAYYDGLGWHIEVINEEYVTGASLQLDSAGRPHILFDDDWDTGLVHAYYDGAWVTEVVDPAGIEPSLVIDAADHLHVAYCAPYYAYCVYPKYAYYDGLAWHIESIDYPGDGGGFPSLDLDTAGRPHMSYVAAYDPDIWSHTMVKYAYYDGADWKTEVLATNTTYGFGENTSLALDAQDRPHISYHAKDNWPAGELRHTYFDGSVWQVEVVDGSNPSNHDTSLVLDAAGRPRIAYDKHHYLLYAHDTTCVVPVEGASISGPGTLAAGQTSLYTATFTPITASLPITFTWSNGTISPTAAYSWTDPGPHTLAVTAANECGSAQGAFTVTVFCQAVESVEVTGPRSLLTDQIGTYQATAQPITSSPPITFTWDSGRSFGTACCFGSAETASQTGPTATFSWTMTGTYTLTVTGTNACGQAQGHYVVQVLEDWPYNVYLPLVLRPSASG